MLRFLAKFYNSSTKLAIITLVLLLLRLKLFSNKNESSVEIKALDKIDIETYLSDFHQSFNSALEPLQYMNKLTTGKVVSEENFESYGHVEYKYFCSKFTKRNDIKSNIQWTFNTPFYVLTAYYDNRENEFLKSKQNIKIIASAYNSSYIEDNTFYCHMFSKQTKQYLYSSKVIIRVLWNRGWDPRVGVFYTAFLLTCPTQDTEEVFLNIGSNSCPGKKSKPILVDHPLQKLSNNSLPTVSVCVKGLDFKEDISSRLIEWIEWQKHFGVKHITFYTYSIENNTSKVLDYYENNFVTSISLTLPGYQPSTNETRSKFISNNLLQKRRNELISYNDCFYRHIHDSDYVLIIDTDEIIVPLKENNYPNMLKHFEKINSASFMVQNVFKFTRNMNSSNLEFPLLSNNKRSLQKQGKESYAKSFIKTKFTTSVFTHFALHKQFRNIKKFYVDRQDSLKLHFRKNCPKNSMDLCDDTIKDMEEDTILKDQSENVKINVLKVRQILGL
uniref:Glycosyltransferase family 92 protein n=1 Tax=Rhabditophanes sp. KR3021 TaxID=114890 RepID=A0AC35TY97_9BILA